MKRAFYIKNMVCDRCKRTVKEIIQAHKAVVEELQLGRIALQIPESFNYEVFKKDLQAEGFELMEDADDQLVERMKILLLDYLKNSSGEQNLSVYLSDRLHKDYTTLSKTFRQVQGLTLEKYFIHLKIEKAKELIQMQDYSFSEIAYQLGYHSISHLSGQFKSITGMTMSEYQKSQDWNRHSLDKIV